MTKNEYENETMEKRKNEPTQIHKHINEHIARQWHNNNDNAQPDTKEKQKDKRTETQMKQITKEIKNEHMYESKSNPK